MELIFYLRHKDWHFLSHDGAAYTQVITDDDYSCDGEHAAYRVKIDIADILTHHVAHTSYSAFVNK